MSMFNIFKKKKKTGDPTDPENMGMLQKLAMKRIMKMKPEDREKLIKDMLKPEKIQKNKKDILEYLEQMERAGKMNKHQVFEAKKRLGIL